MLADTGKIVGPLELVVDTVVVLVVVGSSVVVVGTMSLNSNEISEIDEFPTHTSSH